VDLDFETSFSPRVARVTSLGCKGSPALISSWPCDFPLVVRAHRFTNCKPFVLGNRKAHLEEVATPRRRRPLFCGTPLSSRVSISLNSSIYILIAIIFSF